MTNKELMTEEGYKLLKQKIKDLDNQLKELRLFKGEEAVHAGDSWHDNPTLYKVESEERSLMLQIAEFRVKLANAEIVAVDKNPDCISLGCTVSLKFDDNNIETYRILSEAESNPLDGIISYKSPLGAAIFGKNVGDVVSFTVGNNTESVEILTISAYDIGNGKLC